LTYAETIKLSAQANAQKGIDRLGVIFVSAYVCQGIAQHFCLIAQPLNNFLKRGLHFDAANSALCVSVLMIPWVIKPIYGMVADSWGFSQPGRARLRFLISVHLLAGLAYFALACSLFCLRDQVPDWFVFPAIALVAIAGTGIAFATVIFVAMTVDRSQLKESPRQYFGQQAVAYSVANIAAVSVAGLLCAHLSAPHALAWGLTVSATTLLLLPLVFVRYLDRGAGSSAVAVEKNSLDLWPRVKALARNRSFLLTMLFLTLWNLSPSLGVSLYFFECDKLKFSQQEIGMLTACTSTGSLLGAFIFRHWLARYFEQGRSTYLIVALGVASNLSYLLLSTLWSGVAIEFFHGFVFFVATLAIYGLAADVSPRGLTATSMAIQIAVSNLAMEGSIALGGFLYGRVFGKELLPLIVVSSLTTLLTAFLVPHLARKRL
jgi:MFS family permease